MSQRTTLGPNADNNRKQRSNRGGVGRSFLLGFLAMGGLLFVLLLVVAGLYYAWLLLPEVDDQLQQLDTPIIVNIGTPFDKVDVSLADYTTIQANAIGEAPIQVMQLWVNGVAVDAHAATLNADGVSYTGGFSWQPTGPGEHTLLVRALDINGQVANSNIVRVRAFSSSNSEPMIVPVSEGETLGDIASAFDLSPDQVIALNPQITTAADQPLPPGTTLTVLPPVAPPSLIPPVPPIPPDTSLLPAQPLPQPPTGVVAPANPLDTNPATLFTQLKLGPQFAAPVNPTAPTVAYKLDGCNVNLYLFDQTSNETGFMVYRAKPGDTAFEQIGTLAPIEDATPRIFTDKGWWGNSMYYISAFNAKGAAQSNIVNVTIDSAPCQQPDQTALTLDKPQFTPARSMEKALCYYSVDGGGYARIPATLGTFMYPVNGVFDFSGAFPALASPPPTAPVLLHMRCAGWVGDELIDLGESTNLIQPGSQDPIEIKGDGFTVVGVPNFGQNTAPPPPIVKVIRAAAPDPSQTIAPPYSLTLKHDTKYNAADDTEFWGIFFTWRWGPVGCPVAGAAGCADITDIEGYKIYDMNGAVIATTGPEEKGFFLQLAEDHSFPFGCYEVVAYKGAIESVSSGLECTGGWYQGPLQTIKLSRSYLQMPWIGTLTVSGGEADCQSHGGAANLCKLAAQAKQLILVWDYSDPGCQPGEADCFTLAQVDGVHVYRTDLNEDIRVNTISTTKSSVAFIWVPNEPLSCYAVQVYKGSEESGKSPEVCITANEQGLAEIVVPAQILGGQGAYNIHRTCPTDTTLEKGSPIASNGFTSFDAGYTHTHKTLPCNGTETKIFWQDRDMYFFWSDLPANITKATLRYTVASQYLVEGVAAPPKNCVSSLNRWDDNGGYTTQVIDGAALGTSGSQALDVTDTVKALQAADSDRLLMRFIIDHSLLQTNDSCFSKFSSFSLVIQVGP